MSENDRLVEFYLPADLADTTFDTRCCQCYTASKGQLTR